MTEVNPRSNQTPRLRELLQLGASYTAAAGLLLFAIVRSYYNQFFGSLGIDPTAVGLDYGATLVSAVGLLVYVIAVGLVAPLLLASCIYLAWKLQRFKCRSPIESARVSVSALLQWLPQAFRLLLPLLIILSTAVVTWHLLTKSADFADAVQAGRPIKYGSILVTTFGIRAAPVNLHLAPGVESGSIVETLLRKANESPGLLFIGKADGQLVFYDATTQHSVYLASDAVVLEVVNCDSIQILDARCLNAAS
jgi:hypothetical protein